MENGILVLANKLCEIYNIYESYIWKNNDCKLYVLVENSQVDICLTKDTDVIDRYTIVFDKCEKYVYEYIALLLFNNALGYVIVHKNGETFSNMVHKPYLEFTVIDEPLLNIIDELVYNQPSMHINEGINKMYPQAPFSEYNPKAMSVLDSRKELTRKILRGIKV